MKVSHSIRLLDTLQRNNTKMMLVTSNRRIRFSVLIFIGIAMCQFCTADVFTSMSEMEELMDSHAVLINNLEAYVAAHENKLINLKRRIGEYQKEHDEAARDVGKYVSNPINAYLLMKRLTSDWNILESVMLHDIATEYLQNVTMHRDIMKFPSDEDLAGAALALTRLQYTYNLDTASIARGELNGVQYSTQMTAHDCFEMGRQLYHEADYSYAVLWLHEAINRLNNNTNEFMQVSMVDILEYLAVSMYREGNIRSALETTNDLLKLDPNHQRAVDNKYMYETEISEMIEEPTSTPNENHTSNYHHDEIHNAYHKLCRGELVPDPKILAQLKCRYVMDKSPFLKISPIKLEEVSLNPHVVVYHDVIYDREIELIKQMAKPRFERAGVVTDDGTIESSNYRISKTAWLKDEDHDIVQAITDRIEDMTGLMMETAEDLQVANYGIGGHFGPHHDYIDNDEGSGEGRIATVLFYISDVTQGGATVFPLLKSAVLPQKGSALFWYNVDTAGAIIKETMHAACPVLVGSKWACNKWIKEGGQEFRRPCEVKSN